MAVGDAMRREILPEIATSGFVCIGRLSSAEMPFRNVPSES